MVSTSLKGFGKWDLVFLEIDRYSPIVKSKAASDILLCTQGTLKISGAAKCFPLWLLKELLRVFSVLPGTYGIH